MRRPSWLLALCLGACAEPSYEFVDRSQFQSEFGFFLFLDQSGSPVSQNGPVFLDETAPIHLEPPEDEAESVLFVGWTEADLSKRVPSFDRAEAASLRLHLEGERCQGGAYAIDGSRLRVPLPEPTEWSLLRDAEAWRPTPAPAEVVPHLGPLSLELSPDSSRCLGEDAPAFEPYGGLDPILREGDMVAGRAIRRGERAIRGLARLEDDRLVIASRYSVLLLERGVPFADEPGRAVELIDPDGEFILRDLVVDPDPSRGRNGLRVFVATTHGTLVTAAKPGMLFELELGSDGLELVGTTTVSRTPIETLLLNPSDGRLIAGTRPAAIYTMLPGETLRRVDLPTSDDKRVDLVLTGLPDRPYAIIGTAPGTLLLGDPSASNWETQQGLRDGVTFRGFGVRHLAEGPQFWVGDSDGAIFKKDPGGSWQEVTPKLGPAYWSCFAQEQQCRWYRPTQSTRMILPLDEHDPSRTLMIFEGCSGVVMMRSDTLCSVLLPLGARPLEPLSEEASLATAKLSASWVTVPSSDGSVFEMPRRPE